MVTQPVKQGGDLIAGGEAPAWSPPNRVCAFQPSPASRVSPQHAPSHLLYSSQTGCFPGFLLTGLLSPQDLRTCCPPAGNTIPATLYLDNSYALPFPRDAFLGVRNGEH